MSRQIIPLRRLLNSSSILCSFCRALSHPLDPPVTGFPNPPGRDSTSRSFSARPARSRPSFDDAPRDRRRPPPSGQPKSLIEDEAELSDWVSDIKKDSFRLALTTSDDDDSSDRGPPRSSRGRGMDRDRNSGRGMGMDRDRNSGRGMDRDRFSLRGRGRGRGREQPPSFRDREVNREWDSGRGKERGHSIRTRRRDSDSDDFMEESNRRSSSSFSRPSVRGARGSLSRKRLDSDSEEDEDEEDEDRFLGRQRRGRGGGGRGGFSSTPARRGGRDLDSRSRQDGGGRKPLLSISEDEDVSDDEDDDDEDSDDDTTSGFEDDLLGDNDGEQEENAGDAVERVTSPKIASAQPTSRSTSEANDSYLSQTRFDQCSVSPLSLKGIKAAGYERMTVVQEATLPVILKGKDVLARARTGTGKTVAFLLPSIEVVAKLPPVDRDQKRPPINVLVVCPTRELAAQAATEAETLLKYHPSIGVQVVTGGTRLALEQKRMQANPCQLLVATPGRLRDHIENTPGFATRLMGVKVLVLDEADRLLDMGFRKDIEKIVAAVPRQRQTLLFSATVPEEVRQVCYIAMKRDHEFINTVEEGSEETHSQVSQAHIVAPVEKHFSILYSILTEHISEDVDYKVIIFCTTAMVTRLVADLLSELKLNVREIHSRKPQTYRTRVSKEFKESKGLILVSSDVSARGVDYPNVTLVIQVGVPADREQYVHRLGRTGRKGKEGKGILLLAPWEGFFLDSVVNDLPLVKAPVPPIDPDTKKRVERALAHVEPKNKESAYQAWLGYYNSQKNVARDKYKLVLLANEFSRSMGLDNPPAVPQIVLRKMGLNNIPGLRSK